MFKFFKQHDCDCCGTACETKDEVDYKALAEKLQAKVDQLQTRLNTAYTETGDADFVFNFNAVKAFSIERNWHNDRPCTIVGYVLQEPVTMTEDNVTTKDVVREWYLYCSKEQHAKLVEQFKKAMEQ